MKKYRLLIESAEYPKGTIAEYSSTDEAYVLTYIGSRNSGTASAETWQIENRPEVWEEIVEQEERADVKDEYLPFQPKEGERYWHVRQPLGDIMSSCAIDPEGRHNVFRTQKAAVYEKLRQESMSKRWKPDFEEEYYCYHFNHDRVYNPEWKASIENIHDYFIGNVHRTKKEAEQWAEKYSEAWRVLL